MLSRKKFSICVVAYSKGFWARFLWHPNFLECISSLRSVWDALPRSRKLLCNIIQARENGGGFYTHTARKKTCVNFCRWRLEMFFLSHVRFQTFLYYINWVLKLERENANSWSGSKKGKKSRFDNFESDYNERVSSERKFHRLYTIGLGYWGACIEKR